MNFEKTDNNIVFILKNKNFKKVVSILFFAFCMVFYLFKMQKSKWGTCFSILYNYVSQLQFLTEQYDVKNFKILFLKLAFK